MSRQQTVAVVSTGVANLASMLAALERAGAHPRVTRSAADIETARCVVLPGVGAFGAGMTALREHGLVEALQERARNGKPMLAICLGLQLLCRASDESPGVAGLGVLPEQVRRFATGVRIPQLGWNRIETDPGCRWLQPGHAYFANSYRLTGGAVGAHVARSQHGEPFVAAIERDGLLACQFHPELSGSWGLALLRRWLAGSTTQPGATSC